MKIRKSVLFGLIAFGIGIGASTSVFAQKYDDCILDCMTAFGDIEYCAVICNNARP